MTRLSRMSKLLCISLLIPTVSWSADNNTKTMEMKKDEWLKLVKQVVAAPICKGFMEDASIVKRFKEKNVTYESCLEKIPPITNACINQYYSQLPDVINPQVAAEWGRKLGECIGVEFAKKYLQLDKPGEKQQNKSANKKN